MDRDSRWDRVQKAYDLLVHGTAEHHADSGAQACHGGLRARRDRRVHRRDDGRRRGAIRPGDAVFGLNFRPDRMREITQALADPGFDEIDRGGAEPVERYATLAEYEEGWPYPVAFPPQRPEITMTHVIARAGGQQLHVAETEKYPHVTYFFGGGEEEPETGERRELVPSPRDVATYDEKPEMSAPEAAKAFTGAWAEDGDVRFGIINFANADMVGHTGVIPAAVPAIETVDACLAAGRRGGAGDRRRAAHHRRPRQRRRDARGRRLARHRALAQPGAGDRHGRGADAALRWRAGRRRARRSWSCSAPSSPRR